MTEISIQKSSKSDSLDLEDFLVFNNGERVRNLAQKYIACMFSGDYCAPMFVIAKHNNKIIGCAAYSQELFGAGGTWGISWVSVHADFRCQGVGQKLIESCLEEIQKDIEKPVSVILATYPNKTSLYERCGFSKMGEGPCGGAFMIYHLSPLSSV